MQKFIPKQKLSKKKQKELNSQRRTVWTTLSPVTRVKPGKNVYDRNREKRRNNV